MLLPRSLTSLMLAAALPLAFAACAPEDDAAMEETEEAAETAAPAPAPAAPATPDLSMPMTAQFTALNNSGLAGDIQVSGEGEQTRVVVQLSGSAANGVHQGHIHTGTCDSPGPSVIALQAVTVGADGIGRSESTVAVAPATAMNGQHIVVFHEANGQPGTPVVCAAIPAHM